MNETDGTEQLGIGLSRAELLKRSGLAVGALAAGGALFPGGTGAAVSAKRAPLKGIPLAKARIAQYRKPAKFVPPGPRFNAAPARGKTIMYLPGSLASPVTQQISESMKEACEVVGCKYLTYDAKSIPTNYAAGIDFAISQGVDAIVLASLNPKLFTTKIAEAKRAGMKIIAANTFIRAPFPKNPPGIDNTVSLPYPFCGRLMADWVIADSNGQAEVLIVEQSEFPGSAWAAGAVRDEFKKHAPKIKYTTTGVIFSQWSTLDQRFGAEWIKNPRMNYVITIFDGTAPFLVAGIKAAGAAGKVKLVTFNTSLNVMQALQRRDVVAMDCGPSNGADGWGQVDACLRQLSGQRGLRNNLLLQPRVFDRTNIDTINLSANPDTWLGSNYLSTFKNGFKRLWSVT